MQENRKTLTFVIVAAMAVLVAWEPWRAAPARNAAPEEVGKKLFPKFEDPLAAKSLEIVSYDENNATIADFKVAQINGVWSIPSHSNYPADAKEHMAQAATALLGLEILGVDSSSQGDQELYGVITPDPEKLRPGAVGVGRRVTFKDEGENVLADLVIGKEVKEQPSQHYVRRADRDQIYRVSVKTDKLSTKFEDWIEKDLLKLNGFDVRGVESNDYSLSEAAGAGGGVTLLLKRRSLMKLAYDDSKSSWSVVDMATFDKKGNPVPAPLGEDEELNTEKLNGMKSALDDLQLVDVQRKPKGLSQDLRASDEFIKDNEARMSLIERGFYPIPPENDIYSSEGEATCSTKDGVRYVLRFGNLAGGMKSSDEKNKSNPALNRYLFVMAQFDESQIPKPQLEELPGQAKADDPGTKDDKAGEEKAEPKADDKSADDKPAEEKAAKDKVPEKKTAAADDDEEPAPKAKKKPKKSSAKTKQTAATDADAPPADETAAETKADAPRSEAPKAETPAPEKNEEKSAVPDEEKRIVIEKENKRKQDEYDAAVKKGQDKVKELNDRFADWYFIISDDVYKKIHLGRNDIVKEKKSDKKDSDEAEKQPGVGDLKDLQQGLKAE